MRVRDGWMCALLLAVGCGRDHRQVADIPSNANSSSAPGAANGAMAPMTPAQAGTGGASSTGGANGTGGASSSADSGVAPDHVPVCPSTPPLDGTVCDGRLVCEYGSDEHGRCSWIARCSAGMPTSWRISACGLPSPSCPASFADIVPGAPCPASESTATFCDYDEGRCGCVPCQIDADADAGDATGLMWNCAAWPEPDEGCDIRDRLGGACTTSGKACGNMGGCGTISTSSARVCSDGHWVEDLSGIGSLMCLYPRCES